MLPLDFSQRNGRSCFSISVGNLSPVEIQVDEVTDEVGTEIRFLRVPILTK